MKYIYLYLYHDTETLANWLVYREIQVCIPICLSIYPSKQGGRKKKKILDIYNPNVLTTQPIEKKIGYCYLKKCARDRGDLKEKSTVKLQ